MLGPESSTSLPPLFPNVTAQVLIGFMYMFPPKKSLPVHNLRIYIYINIYIYTRFYRDNVYWPANQPSRIFKWYCNGLEGRMVQMQA